MESKFNSLLLSLLTIIGFASAQNKTAICEKCAPPTSATIVDISDDCMTELLKTPEYFCDNDQGQSQAVCTAALATKTIPDYVEENVNNYILDNCFGVTPTSVVASSCTTYEPCVLTEDPAKCSTALKLASNICEQLYKDTSYCPACTINEPSRCEAALKLFSTAQNCSQYLTPRNNHNTTFTPDKYEVLYPVGYLHDTPRVKGGNKIDFDNTTEYFQGIAAVGAFLASIGILGLIIVTCYITCCKKNPDNPPGCLKRSMFLSCVGLGVVAIIIGYAAVGQLETSVDSLDSSAKEIIDIFDSAVTASQLTENKILETKAINNQIIAACSQSEVGRQLAIVNEELDKALKDVKEFNESTVFFSTFQGNFERFQDYNSYTSTGGLVAFGVFLLPVFIFGGGVLASITCGSTSFKCTKTMGCISMPLLLLIMCVAWISAGAFLSMGVAISDFCIDPDPQFPDIVQEVSNSGVNDPIVNMTRYLTNCQGTDYITESLIKAENGLIDAADQTDIATLYSVIDCRENYTRAQILLPKLKQNIINGSNFTYTVVEPLVACSTLNPIYTAIVHDNVCVTIIRMVNQLWVACLLNGLCILMCAFMFFGIISPGGGSDTNKVAFRDPYDL